LRIARRISGRVLEKYGSKILAVYVCGSTSKNLDRPFSDLELIVVVRDGVEIPMKYYLYKGLIIEVDYLQSSNILRAAERFTDNWHMEADQYRNRIVLFDRGRWFNSLERAVAKNEKADVREAIRKMFLMMTESRAVLKNAVLAKDKIGIFSRARVIGEDAARIVFLLNRTYVTTTSWFWKIAFEAPKKPKDFRVLIEKICGFRSTTPKEVVGASEMLYREMCELVGAERREVERVDLYV
jgi:predicted nucleotidyltransferase